MVFVGIHHILWFSLPKIKFVYNEVIVIQPTNTIDSVVYPVFSLAKMISKQNLWK
jgi:hypothetical protein